MSGLADRIEARQAQGLLAAAQPLPSIMDALAIEHMIRADEEQRREPPEEGLGAPPAMPQEHPRSGPNEGHQVIPQRGLIEEVLFEGIPIRRRGPYGVAHQVVRGGLGLRGFLREESRPFPMGPQEVLGDEA